MTARSRPSLLFGRPVVTGKAEQDKLNEQRLELLRHWAAHPWNWLTGKDLDGRPIIWTKDEKDEKAPLKPFPAHLVYLRLLVEVLFSPTLQVVGVSGAIVALTRFLLIDKARQMYVSTVIIALMDWWCRFRPHRRFLVSKVKEEDAIELINDKARGIEDGLPMWVRRALPQDPRPAAKINYPKNVIGGGGSYILGVAQNVAESSARGGTATAILVDEAAFQDSTDEIIDGARPMASRIWVVSSPYLGTPGGVTMKKILDYGLDGQGERGEEVELIHGLKVRVTPQPHGWTIASLDWDADPSHDEAWLEAARGGYTDPRKFRREILRDWASAAGLPFYPEWSDTGGDDAHIKRAPGIMPGVPVVRGWDFGVRNPACIWLQYDRPRRRVWYLRELSLQGIGTYAFADLVLYFSGQLGEDQLTPYVRQWVRNLSTDPRYREPFFKPLPNNPIDFLDWAGHEATQERAEVADENADKSSADILAAKGIELSIQYGAVRSGHEIMRELMRVRADGWSGCLVDPHCKLFAQGLGGGITFKKGTAENPYSEEVRKDGVFSHIHEAGLYPLSALIELPDGETPRAAAQLAVNQQAGLVPADEAYVTVRD
jgi:hypothetical protein